MVALTYFIILTDRCNLSCKHCYVNNILADMSQDVLNKCKDYILTETKNIQDTININYVGGEIGLYNQNYILDNIMEFKKIKCNLKFFYNTNLCYKITDEHLKLFDELYEIGTSYDYAIRWHNHQTEQMWYNNIKFLQQKGYNLRLTITLTEQFLDCFTPSSFLEYIKAIGIYNIEFNRVLPTHDGHDISFLMPKNEKVRNWWYDFFILYEKYRRHDQKLFCINLECIRDSFNGNYNFEHSRTCCRDNRTFLPNGNVVTCMQEQNKPIYNVITNTIKMNESEIYNFESRLENCCVQCKYLQYCKGDCHLYLSDETGCSTPYKIYDYLSEKHLLDWE